MNALIRPADAAGAVPSAATDGAGVSVPVPVAGRVALRVQAALLDCGGLDEATRVVVRELAQHLGFSRVSMALVQPDGTLQERDAQTTSPGPWEEFVYEDYEVKSKAFPSVRWVLP